MSRDNGDDFSIDGEGVLTFSTPPDFEVPADTGGNNVYEATVVATDNQGSSGTFDVTITVTDVNEGPEITLVGNAQGSVPENQDVNTVLATYSGGDPEMPGEAITRWSTSGRDGGDFTIHDSGELRFRNTPDYERPADANRGNTYNLSVRASDGRYYGYLEVTVAVTNLNEAPIIATISRTEFSQRENTTSILYTYRATDQDRSDAIRWSVEGEDGDDFAIYNGMLTFRLLPDYAGPADSNQDTQYQVTVVAADLRGLRDTVDATVTITEVNEGPVVSGRNSFTMAKNQDLIGASFSASDQEGEAITRWSLSGSDGGDFLISETGVLTFRNTPDYDRPADSNRDNVYRVTVRAYDAGNLYGSLDVAVTVTDVNEEAPVVTGRISLSFRENTAITTRLYTYRATDTDRDTTIMWLVEGDDRDDFEIDGGS